MKSFFQCLSRPVLAAVTAMSLFSCDMLGPGVDHVGEEGQLRISFAPSLGDLTKTVSEIPDTCDFILNVSNADGDVLYNGSYGASPESIMVTQGTYTVSVISQEFRKPSFSAPQFGDQQCVVVPAGGVVNVRLACSQLNCGVRLNVDPLFLTSYPDGVLFLKSSDGKLMYGYSEKRTAYFRPGNVSLILSSGGTDKTLLTRTLEARQMLVLGVSVAQTSSSACERISVSVDTSRVWLSDTYVIGGDSGKGSGASDALTVSEAMSSVGSEDVWVSGYIVGGDLSSSSASFDGPFSSRTCLLLGPRSSTKDRASCISVQLPAGELREALNLVDNPELLGRKMRINGDIVSSYYGLTGLKNCKEYAF